MAASFIVTPEGRIVEEKSTENKSPSKDSSNSTDKVANKINAWVILGIFLVIGAIGATTLGSLGLFNIVSLSGFSIVSLSSLTASKIILASGISSFALSIFAFAKGSKVSKSNSLKLGNDLIEAAKKGEGQKVLELLNSGANVDAQDKRKMTPLMHAALRGNLKIVELLLQKGASVDIENNVGLKASGYADSNNHTEIKEILEKKEAPVLSQENIYTINTLDKWNKNVSLIRNVLLIAGIAGITIATLGLCHVVILPSLVASKIILALGISSLAGSLVLTLFSSLLALGKKSILHKAQKEAQKYALDASLEKEIAKILEEDKKSKPRVEEVPNNPKVEEPKNESSSESDLISATKDGDIERLKELLKTENINKKDEDGWTALMHAANMGHLDMVLALIEANSNVDEKSNWGHTALMLAARNNYLEIVQALLVKKAEVDEKTKQGLTALMFAAVAGFSNIVKILLDNGAKVDETTSWGQTALMYAASNNRREIIEVLIDRGAEIDKVDTNKGKSALVYAEEYGFDEKTAKLLRDKGQN